MRRVCVLALVLLGAASSRADMQESNVLLVWNSQSAESTAVRDAYLLAHPGVFALDLSSAALASSGTVHRFDYLSFIRTPVRNFINGVTTGIDRSQQIMAIVTTRGVPSRINFGGGADEFALSSTWSSVEADLVLLQQDLEQEGVPGVGLYYRFNGMADNPYHFLIGQPITNFSRANIKVQRGFTPVVITDKNEAIWSINGLTPGDMYLVCRLDAAASPEGGGNTAAQNIQALIARSQGLTLDRCSVLCLFDEFNAPPPPEGFQYDNVVFPPVIQGGEDFENTAGFLSLFGITAWYDNTYNFVLQSELPNGFKPLLVYGSYGKNHGNKNWGEPPPGGSAYIQNFTFHPAAMFNSYESWNGTSIYAPGTTRGEHGQVLDFIARGGSFTVGHLMEPREFTVTDLQAFAPGFYRDGLTFAEAVWSSIPVLSWQHVPIGDPLARVRVLGHPACAGDANFDRAVDFADVTAVLAGFGGSCAQGSSAGDANGDRVVNFADVIEVLRLFGAGC